MKVGWACTGTGGAAGGGADGWAGGLAGGAVVVVPSGAVVVVPSGAVVVPSIGARCARVLARIVATRIVAAPPRGVRRPRAIGLVTAAGVLRADGQDCDRVDRQNGQPTILGGGSDAPALRPVVAHSVA